MSLELEVACDTKPKKWRSADVKTTENVEFRSLLLSDRILHGLKNCGFERPSPVQLQAIPLGRCGIDLVVQAKSGTGKTCVLAVIALDSLIEDSQCTQVLILAPTREIACQICGVVRSLGCAFPELTCETFIGGLPLSTDKAKLPKCQIVVGTPGRIKQLIDMEHLQTDSIRLFIVDEADRLFDKQFKEDISWIFSSLPSRKQILALSATYPEELSNFLSLYMENPVYVRINSKDPALLGVTQYFHSTPFHPMLQVTDSAKFDVLLDILNTVTFSQCMIFCQRQSKAQDLADNLVLKGFPSLGICSALDQVRRLEIIHELKTFQCRVLVSTDLTARGIDAENVNLVINFDIPYEGEVYLHRIGRAGRYGTRGMAISLASSGDEIKRMKSFQKKFLFKIYQLPDPVPSDLWEVTVALQALTPEEPEDEDLSTKSNGSIKTNDVNDSTAHENSSQENKPDQVPAVNNSSTIQDKSEKNTPEMDKCLNDSAEIDGTAVENSCDEKYCHLQSGMKICQVTVSETGKIYEVTSLHSSITEGQIESEKQNGYQPTSQVENGQDVGLKIVPHTDTTEDISVLDKLFVQEIEGSAIHIPGGDNSAATSSPEMVANIILVEESNHNTVTLDISDLDRTKTEDLNINGNKNQYEKNSSRETNVFDPIKADDSKNVGLMTESESDSTITVTPGKQVVHSEVTLESLFQNWEIPLQGTENSEISDEEISNILVPLLNGSKTECFNCDLSYSKLVDSWESYNKETSKPPSKLYSETSFPGSTPTLAQLEVMQKYMWRDKIEFLSRMQRTFSELYKDHIPYKRDETSDEPLNHSCVNNDNSDFQHASILLNDHLASQPADVFQSGSVASHESVVNLKQDENELLENICISDSVVMQEEDQNHNEIMSSVKESKDTECAKANTSGKSSTVATEPLPEVADSPKQHCIPINAEKSEQVLKEDSPAYKYNTMFHRKVHNITEADYESVNCGKKHYKIVPLPSELSDSPKKSSVASVKNHNSGHTSRQKSKVKNQSVRKKVKNEARGTSQKMKKQECHENYFNSVQIPTSEQNVSDKNGGLASSVCQETETEPGKNATPVHAFVPPKTADYSVDYKKKQKLRSPKYKHMNNFGSCHENEINSCSTNHNPVNFINNDMNDYFSHADFYKTSGCPQYYPNRVKQVSSNVTCIETASRSPNHGMCSSCVNSPHASAPTLQYDCCCRRSYVCQSAPASASTFQYGCCCRPSYVSQNQCYFQSPIPLQNTGPQYYYGKYLELWYYIQNLTYGHLH